MSPPAPAHVKQISAGWNFALAVKSDGTVWAWGANDYGQLGTDNAAGSLVPFRVKAIGRNVIQVAAGNDHSVALKADGSVWAWGLNDRGQLGSGNTAAFFTPVKVSGLNGRFTAIVAGYDFSLALRSDGTVWGWGDDYQGQLGNGSNADTTSAVPVTGLTGRVAAISVGKGHSLALMTDGSVRAWGDNGSDALGSETVDVYQNTPIRVEGFKSPVVAMWAGVDHSAVVTSEGTVWSWGVAFIPSGKYMGTETPTPVSGLVGVRQVTAGWDFFVALESNGSVWAWGENLDTLGDGTGHDSLATPVHVLGLDSGVASIATGSFDSYAIRANGTVLAWGNNNNGELGNGTKDPTGGSASPVEVKSF
jgi:alpha-tubulin suppressor-like RCC1 family protein